MIRRLITIGITLVALAGVLAIFAWGIQDASVRSYEITGVDIENGLVIRGVLELENPSMLPVPVRSVPYDVVTDGGVIARGAVDGFLLAPGVSQSDMSITLTSESALSALRTRGTQITVNGTVVFDVPLAPELAFSDTYELSDDISRLGEILNTAKGGSDEETDPLGDLI